MFSVYIIYSKKLDKFYVGFTEIEIEERLERHNSLYYLDKYTSKGIPWTLYFYLKCETKSQALKIEKHIKSMKSRKYYESLTKYSEISNRLLLKYK